MFISPYCIFVLRNQQHKMNTSLNNAYSNQSTLSLQKKEAALPSTALMGNTKAHSVVRFGDVADDSFTRQNQSNTKAKQPSRSGGSQFLIGLGIVTALAGGGLALASLVAMPVAIAIGTGGLLVSIMSFILGKPKEKTVSPTAGSKDTRELPKPEPVKPKPVEEVPEEVIVDGNEAKNKPEPAEDEVDPKVVTGAQEDGTKTGEDQKLKEQKNNLPEPKIEQDKPQHSRSWRPGAIRLGIIVVGLAAIVGWLKMRNVPSKSKADPIETVDENTAIDEVDAQPIVKPIIQVDDNNLAKPVFVGGLVRSAKESQKLYDDCVQIYDEHAFRVKQYRDFFENNVEVETDSVQYDSTFVNIFEGITTQESKGKRDQVSKAGAAGIMQLTENTARTHGLNVVGKTDERFDPEKNTKGGVSKFKDLYGTYGFVEPTVAGYNCGKTGVDRALILAALELSSGEQLKRYEREVIIQAISIYARYTEGEKRKIIKDEKERIAKNKKIKEDKDKKKETKEHKLFTVSENIISRVNTDLKTTIYKERDDRSRMEHYADAYLKKKPSDLKGLVNKAAANMWFKGARIMRENFQRDFLDDDIKLLYRTAIKKYVPDETKKYVPSIMLYTQWYAENKQYQPAG